MTDNELKELVASLAIAQKEMTISQKEMNIFQKELSVAQKETFDKVSILQKATFEEISALQADTWKQIKQVNKQLGELGNKWGTFTEGMALESIKKILLEKFKIQVTSQNYSKRMDGESIEIDVFGYENSLINTAVVVEIKSHLREDAVEQIENTMTNFPKFFPDHADKKLYGIIACVHAPENIKNVLRKKGIYLAVLHDDIFKLYPFKHFTPKDFSH